MKEQWKKLDSDAKLLVDVEEGRQLPIKIKFPLSALAPPQDHFCCNRLLTVLRVCVLLALLLLLGWTAATLFGNYYSRTVQLDQQRMPEKFALENRLYQIKDVVDTKEESKETDSKADEFRDSTKKALDIIAGEMKDFTEKLDHIKVDKEIQQVEAKKELVDAKPLSDEEITPDEQTLDSMLDHLAEEVGLGDKNFIKKVEVQSKPETDAIIITDSRENEATDLETEALKNTKTMNMKEYMTLMKRLGILQDVEEVGVPVNIDESHEESGYQTKLISDVGYQPFVLDNTFLNEKPNEETQFNKNSENGRTDEQIQKEFFGMLDRIAAESINIDNMDESHEDDKQIDEAIQAWVDRIAASDMKNIKSSEENKKEDKIEDGIMEELSDDLEGQMMDQIIGESLGNLFLEVMNEATNEDNLSKSSMENNEESYNEDKVEREMMDELGEDIKEKTIEPHDEDILELAVKNEEVTLEESPGNDSESDLIDTLFGILIDDPTTEEIDQETFRFDGEISDPEESDYLTTVIPEETNKFMNKEENINQQAPIQAESSTESPLVEMVPSVEYVKKIEENPFIPRVAKMLEPIVGQNHELLVWYYTHKDLPEFLRGSDKWKVFGAKLLYDSNIKDYPADATIISGLVFEKVYSGAEYPSSSEEIKSDLQQEIVNRLILKSYLNKMLLEGNAEAETLSEIIEQHNQQKLKELDIDPEKLAYKGDFFQIDNIEDEEPIIPVVRFDPFVDESREANEQRIQVIKAFDKTRNVDEEVSMTETGKDSKNLLNSLNQETPAPVIPEIKLSEESVKSSESETEKLSDASLPEKVSREITEDIESTTAESDDYYSDEEVDMNEYLTWYDMGPYDW